MDDFQEIIKKIDYYAARNLSFTNKKYLKPFQIYTYRNHNINGKWNVESFVVGTHKFEEFFWSAIFNFRATKNCENRLSIACFYLK